MAFKFITISTIHIKIYKACPWSGFRQLAFVPFLSTFPTIHMELNEIQPYHLQFFMKSEHSQVLFSDVVPVFTFFGQSFYQLWMYVRVVKLLMWVTLILSPIFWILRTAQFQVLSYWSSAHHYIWTRVCFEHLVYPSCILGHADEDTWSVVSGTSSAVDAHSHYNLTVLFLTHQWSTVVFLLKWK